MVHRWRFAAGWFAVIHKRRNIRNAYTGGNIYVYRTYSQSYRYGVQLDAVNGGAGLAYAIFSADNVPVISTVINPAGHTLAAFTGNGTKAINLHIDESDLESVERGVAYSGHIVFGIKLE